MDYVLCITGLLLISVYAQGVPTGQGTKLEGCTSKDLQSNSLAEHSWDQQTRSSEKHSPLTAGQLGKKVFLVAQQEKNQITWYLELPVKHRTDFYCH